MRIAVGRGPILRPKSAAGGLGPTPAFGAAGAVSRGNIEDLILGFPPGITAGQLLIIHVESTNIADSPATPEGWIVLHDDQRNSGGGNAIRQWIYWKYATGSESGNLALNFGASGNKIAFISRWANPHPFSPFEGAALVQGTDDPITGPTLTPAGPNRLGAAFIAVGDNQVAQTTFAGATGGTWANRYFDAEGAGADSTIFLNTVDLSGGGQISGGSFAPAMVTAADWLVRGLLIRPSGA